MVYSVLRDGQQHCFTISVEHSGGAGHALLNSRQMHRIVGNNTLPFCSFRYLHTSLALYRLHLQASLMLHKGMILSAIAI